MPNKDRSFLAVKQKRQDVTNHQSFGEGQGQVLVLAEAKTLPHPFVEGLVPSDGSCDRASGFGFATHASRARNRWLDHLNAQQEPQLLRGARNPKVPTLFQVADVDTGTITWVNADLVTHIVPRV